MSKNNAPAVGQSGSRLFVLVLVLLIFAVAGLMTYSILSMWSNEPLQEKLEEVRE